MSDRSLKILIADAQASALAQAIGTLPEGAQLAVAESLAEAQQCLQACEVILGAPDWISQMINEADGARWVQSTWAGVDRLMAPELRQDYVLTSVKDVFGQYMAEYVLCYLLMHERKVIQRLAAQAARRWDADAPGSVAGKTLCVVGLGNIGGTVARQCAHVGMRVLGVNASGRAVSGVEQVGKPKDLSRILQACDYVVSVLPETSETRQLIDAELIARMKPGAYFINVGRGGSVDHVALADAVEAGRLSGAALDVFEVEPLPTDSPLWDTRNVIITSHTAAPSFAEPIAALFLSNLHRYLAGEALHHEVDFERGY